MEEVTIPANLGADTSIRFSTSIGRMTIYKESTDLRKVFEQTPRKRLSKTRQIDGASPFSKVKTYVTSLQNPEGNTAGNRQPFTHGLRKPVREQSWITSPVSNERDGGLLGLKTQSLNG